MQPRSEVLQDDIEILARRIQECGAPEPTPEDNVCAAEEARLLHRALERLKPPRREVLELRYVDDLAYAEIATLLGISRNNVGVRLSNALGDLRNALLAQMNVGVNSTGAHNEPAKAVT